MAEPMEIAADVEQADTGEPVHDHRWQSVGRASHETHAYQCEECGVAWAL